VNFCIKLNKREYSDDATILHESFNTAKVSSLSNTNEAFSGPSAQTENLFVSVTWPKSTKEKQLSMGQDPPSGDLL